MKVSPKELDLQRRIHKLFSDPSMVFKTFSGKRLQILSPGRHNHNEGPDFLDIAILLEGTIIIGDAEVHNKASEWSAHSHQLDHRYKNVVLHIVTTLDTPEEGNFETLVIDPSILPQVERSSEITTNEVIDSLEEIQNYALLRLLRKTSEAHIVYEKLGLEYAFKILMKNFLDKYFSKRHRPFYSKFNIDNLIDKFAKSKLFEFLIGIQSTKTENLAEQLFSLMKTKIETEGNHLRREIILNCLLPLAIAIANESERISLFVWFWSTPALNSYGKLTRKFPSIPQNFIWQQQGMLEILNNLGKKSNPISTTIQNFRIGEVLSFFQIGNPPF